MDCKCLCCCVDELAVFDCQSEEYRRNFDRNTFKYKTIPRFMQLMGEISNDIDLVIEKDTHLCKKGRDEKGILRDKI